MRISYSEGGAEKQADKHLMEEAFWALLLFIRDVNQSAKAEDGNGEAELTPRVSAELQRSSALRG